ncbi:MAG TPA: DUF2076 domain-containing protein [Granulicella sp.]|nr:DUF2076 domain-containing protein [Granulicella sp.]
MTAQEQQMLQGLVERINGTQLPEKDADAEQYLQQTLGRNPDAMYILAQTVLVQQYALTQAQKQLADAKADQLRQQAQQPKHSTSFLGSLLGRSDEPERPAPPPPPPPASYAQPPYTPVPSASYAQPQYTPVPPPPPPAYAPAYAAPAYSAPPSQTGGFLRGAAQTAAGVAAGALAFEGVESLMHGFGHSAGYGSDMGFGGFGGGGGRPEEIVNNYYVEDSGQNDRSSGFDNASSGGNDEVADDTSYDDGSNSDDFDSGGDSFDV